jgi:hypothetical protein
MQFKNDFYEFVIIPFKLCKTSSTFTTLMNLIFHEKLNEFIWNLHHERTCRTIRVHPKEIEKGSTPCKWNE